MVDLMESLYGDNTMVVRAEGEKFEAFCAEQVVRQGCILSPHLFNIYGDCILREMLENWNGGISISERKISNLRYADDTTLIAADEGEIGELIDRVKAVSERLGLGINAAKTKVMVVDRVESLLNFTALGEYEEVKIFVYLGSIIEPNGSSLTETTRRISQVSGRPC